MSLLAEAEDCGNNIGQESDFGNVEYKLKLVSVTADRFQHLITQMKWRLDEGNNEAMYEIGVEDNGFCRGICDTELEETLDNLRRMSIELDANIEVVCTHPGEEEGLQCAEVLVKRNVPETEDDSVPEIRVATIGNVDSGKSTLVGVLTTGVLDDGRGLARMHVFRHKHEIVNGRTSSISHHDLAFDRDGHLTTLSHGSLFDGFDQPNPAKLLTFVDMAGHEKYFKTTVSGLTASAPDYAMIVVGANSGVQRMTREHLGIAIALEVPVFVVVSKIDLAPEHILQQTMQSITNSFKNFKVRANITVVQSLDDAVQCSQDVVSRRSIPVFHVSNVTGEGLDLLRSFLGLIPARKEWDHLRTLPTQFLINETFSVHGVGTVVAGTVLRGTVSQRDQLLLGPDTNGNFKSVSVKSIHTKHMPIATVTAGQSASFTLKLARGEKLKRSQVRKGMMLLSPSIEPRTHYTFDADIFVLHHPGKLQHNYQPVVHARNIHQAAAIISMDKDELASGDRARVRFRFLFRPEYIINGSTLVFREGRLRGVGRITSVGEGDRKLSEYGHLRLGEPVSMCVESGSEAKSHENKVHDAERFAKNKTRRVKESSIHAQAKHEAVHTNFRSNMVGMLKSEKKQRSKR